MSAAAQDDTVWIGFMDIVPVIGTVKEAVELVLALYDGNKAVIREKERALENIVKDSSKKKLKKMTATPAAAAGVVKFSGLRNVTEVRLEEITEHVNKGSKKETKASTSKPSTSDEQKARERRFKEIKKDMLEKIHIINPNFNRELTEELKRSRRGEHVFNNGILRFHSNVLTEFIQKHHIDNLQRYNRDAMDRLGRNTLTQNATNEIQTNMVVHFENNEDYVNANAVMYGEYCRELRLALFNVLDHINPHDVTEEERQRVDLVIYNMNEQQIYVDQLAKAKWIGNFTDRQDRFERVRREVADMYNARGVGWCNDIMNAVSPWFEHGA